MRMNLATDSIMERFLAYLLAHPERFARSEVPCCLQGLWEEALDDMSGLAEFGKERAFNDRPIALKPCPD